MKIVIDGKEAVVPAGGGGICFSGGPPIGTIISYLGTTAPEGYLICDGSVYGVADYSNLAEFFEVQFGSKNHFGGNGSSTFAVPDMRNMFLRGYHGEAEMQLSGEIGQKQEGTIHPHVSCSTTGSGTVRLRMIEFGENINAWDNVPQNTDTSKKAIIASTVYGEGQATLADTDTRPMTYTARPVNVAVLYCIKATGSIPNAPSASVTVEPPDALSVRMPLYTAAPQSAAAVELTGGNIPGNEEV